MSGLYVSQLSHVKTRTVQTLWTFCYIRVNCGRGSVLLWRQCNAFCTSGFVDDVTFVCIVGQANATPTRRIVKMTHQRQYRGAKLDAYKQSYMIVL